MRVARHAARVHALEGATAAAARRLQRAQAGRGLEALEIRRHGHRVDERERLVALARACTLIAALKHDALGAVPGALGAAARASRRGRSS